MADLYEWGERTATANFCSQVPAGMGAADPPAHGEDGVTIFFQGHDHLFARQEKDGVVYQEVPNPRMPPISVQREAYRSGDILPHSGHLRVTVAPDQVRVDYVAPGFRRTKRRTEERHGGVLLRC